jgi:Ni,Fe-hydrogenase I large subunit
MAGDLVSDYKKDKESRADWEKSYIKGLDLLGFKYSEESRPFVGASSVTHPLLAEAVTQFQAQAYKELLPSNGPVKTQVIGERNPEREQQAQRVKEFMNYMLTDKMEE